MACKLCNRNVVKPYQLTILLMDDGDADGIRKWFEPFDVAGLCRDCGYSLKRRLVALIGQIKKEKERKRKWKLRST